MSMTARLLELRTYRTAQALLEVHHAIDAAVVDVSICSDQQVERLGIMRELAVHQLERLSTRVRRNPPLRGSIEAACRAYRTWMARETGSEAEQRAADDLAVGVIRLCSVLSARPEESAPEPLFDLAFAARA